jgi:pimeloyl-ACP methyl ester carboxylesterase
MWRPVIERLPDYHCLVPDLPEQGQSVAIKPFSMDFAAQKVAELIRSQAHGGKAHVVGLSEGAQVTVALLAAAPEVLTSAIVSSALLRPLPGGWLLSPAMLAAMYYTSVAPFKNWDAWMRLNMKYAAAVPDAYYPEFKHEFQSMTKDGWMHMMRANQTFRLPEGLARANLPVLVIAGAREYKAMLDSVRDLVRALPNARGVIIDLGSKASMAQEHNWALSAPELFADTVRAWVTGSGSLPEGLKPL